MNWEVDIYKCKKDQQEHADMKNNRSKIELRSKKIRSIIGLEPSWLVQWGITIIAVIVAIILLAGYYVFSNMDLSALLEINKTVS